MKKTFRLFSMAALVLVMAACSNDDNDTPYTNPAEAGVVHFSATLPAPNSGATSRTTYTLDKNAQNKDIINVAWRAKEDGVYEGDKIALVHNSVVDIVTVTAVDASGNATIEGTITGSPSDDSDVALVYPAATVNTEAEVFGINYTPNATAMLDKVNNQDGTLDYIQNNIDFRQGTGKLAVPANGDVSLKEGVSMPSSIAIWKLTLQDGAKNALEATTVTVKFGSTTLATASASAKSVYYLGIVPTWGSGDLTIEATVGSDTYYYTKVGGVTLETGKYYQSTVTMVRPLSKAAAGDVGRLAGLDGNIYATVAAAGAAGTIAMAKIVYVGLTGNDTYTHGLALALEDENNSGSLTWEQAKTAISNKNTNTPIPGALWVLASQAQWNLMRLPVYESGGDWTTLRDGFASVGGINLYGSYWTIDDNFEIAEDAGIYQFTETEAGPSSRNRNDPYGFVRACLVF